MNSGLPFKVLVVDDDEDDFLIMDEAFKEIGYQTEIKKFINGKSLLYYLESIEPNLYPSLIILDNALPGQDASDILSVLKSHPAYKSIPVVVYTTMISESRKEQLLSIGAYACFKKGNSMSEVIAVAKELRQMAESLDTQPKTAY